MKRTYFKEQNGIEGYGMENNGNRLKWEGIEWKEQNRIEWDRKEGNRMEQIDMMERTKYGMENNGNRMKWEGIEQIVSHPEQCNIIFYIHDITTKIFNHYNMHLLSTRSSVSALDLSSGVGSSKTQPLFKAP